MNQPALQLEIVGSGNFREGCPKLPEIQPLNKSQLGRRILLKPKSGVLDQFWTRAEEQPALYVAALLQELGNFTNPPFFLYDGSILLLSLSDTPADRKTALAAISHCDLRDLRATDYFLQVHHLAALNEDTTAAAFHVLEQPDFKVVFGEHVLQPRDPRRATCDLCHPSLHR